jgi:hypothetical protein
VSRKTRRIIEVNTDFEVAAGQIPDSQARVPMRIAEMLLGLRYGGAGFSPNCLVVAAQHFPKGRCENRSLQSFRSSSMSPVKSFIRPASRSVWVS